MTTSITAEEIEVDLMNLDSYLDNLVEDTDLRAKGVSIEGGMTKREARAFIVSLLERREGLLTEKDNEIKCLNAQLDGIRAAREEAQAVLSMLNADPTVATFQIATHFQVMGNKVGRILQEGQSEGVVGTRRDNPENSIR